MLRIGVAGVGNLGKTHIGNLQKMADRATITALADPIPERRAGLNLRAETLNIDLDNQRAVSVGGMHAHADYRDLCADDEVDAVVIAMPTDLHAPAAVLALENGKHVFTEKPMALTPADCRRMIAAAKASRRALMVGQVLRFWPAYVEAGRVMSSGRYGRVLSATMRRFGRHPEGWFADYARSGGVNLDLHIHDVDTALSWWGKPQSLTSHTSGAAGRAQAVLSHWRYRNGLVVHMEALWDVGTRFSADFRIVMEGATLDYSMSQGKELRLTTAGGPSIIELPAAATSPYFDELACFLRCAAQGTNVPECPPGESALAVRYATLPAPRRRRRTAPSG